MAHDSDREGRTFVDFTSDIGVFTDLIAPKEGDKASVELFGSFYRIQNFGAYNYNSED